jgi:long-chain fatty acid transport protein
MQSLRFDFAVPVRRLLCAAALFSTGSAYAAGFALNEMSASGVGSAFAGSGAVAEDLGTIYYNPAGLSRMCGRQFMLAGSLFKSSF